MRYHLFDKQPRSVRDMAEDDLAAADATYLDRDVDVGAITEMTPLSTGGGRSARHPLDGRPHRASRRQPDNA